MKNDWEKSLIQYFNRLLTDNKCTRKTSKYKEQEVRVFTSVICGEVSLAGSSFYVLLKAWNGSIC